MAESSSSLPQGCVLSPASASDIWQIRRLVLSAKLDPTQLRWSQFWIIRCEGHLVACGQLRSFTGAQELGSLVVAPAWRGRGLGTFLVKHLVAEATEPLYLECLGPRLKKFYLRLGFVPVSWSELPRPLKLKFGFSALAARVGLPVTIIKVSSVDTPSKS